MTDSTFIRLMFLFLPGIIIGLTTSFIRTKEIPITEGKNPVPIPATSVNRPPQK